MVNTRPGDVISRSFIRFLKLESAGGIVMMTAAALALVVANTPLSDAYFGLWHTYAGAVIGEWSLKMSFLHWVNDGLMAVFFFLVGLEIKREVLFGELASVRRAALPIVGAVGGAVIPALIFLALNASSGFASGWGIPMATDIAFAVAILALLGTRAPLWLKTFVTALAIADDIMAVLVIALFYSGALNLAALGWATALLVVLFLLNRAGVQRPLAYVVPILLLWYFVYQSGIHATIAGVLAASTIPASRRRETAVLMQADLSQSLELVTSSLEKPASSGADRWEAKDIREEVLTELAEEAHGSSAPLYRMEHAIHPWVVFFVLPVFAFANAGIAFPSVAPREVMGHPLTLGIILGLFVGKQVGITGATWLAVKLGLGELPSGGRWRTLWGGSLLAGIGFTMSIFIASLAFVDPASLDLAKIGVVVGSLVSAVLGIVVLRVGRPEDSPAPADG